MTVDLEMKELKTFILIVMKCYEGIDENFMLVSLPLSNVKGSYRF